MYFPTQASVLPEPGRLRMLQTDYGNPLQKGTLLHSATISGHRSRRKLPCFPIWSHQKLLKRLNHMKRALANPTKGDVNELASSMSTY